MTNTTLSIPSKEEYEHLVCGSKYFCTSCHRWNKETYELKYKSREKYMGIYYWLCSDCFKKLIPQEDKKEVVQFT